MLIYLCTDLQSANFRGNPFCQATKRHLNNSSTLKTMENKMRSEITFLLGLSCCCFLPSAWKTVGTTMTDRERETERQRHTERQRQRDRDRQRETERD